MRSVEVTREEVESGKMRLEHVDAAVEAMKEEGVVLLPGVIDTDHVDALGEKMLDDIKTLDERTGINGNWAGVRPPPFHPHLFADIVYNEMAIAVTHRLLGNGVVLDSYGTNTAFQLWPNLETVPPPHCIVVNVSLVDVDESNGATKVWLGTHKNTRTHAQNRQLTEEMIAEHESERPVERMCTKRGDLVVRDMRVWHCGMPNFTDTPRPMLAMIHRCEWSQKWGFETEKGSEDFFNHPVLENSAVFVDAPVDYLHQGHSRPLQR